MRDVGIGIDYILYAMLSVIVRYMMSMCDVWRGVRDALLDHS